jgi:hypothetical protein
VILNVNNKYIINYGYGSDVFYSQINELKNEVKEVKSDVEDIKFKD